LSSIVRDQEFWFNLSQSEWHSREIREVFSKVDTSILTVLDIGANMGASITFFANYFKPSLIIAIEPDDENIKTIREVCSSFVQERTVLRQAAIYYCSEKQLPVFDSNDGNSGGYTIKPGPNSHNTGKVFDICDLESAINSSFVMRGLDPKYSKVDLAKIDIEGSEYNVIEHSALIKLIPWLFIEWRDVNNIDTKEFIAKHLSNHEVVYTDSRGSTLLRMTKCF
jgi:FkbM family methyltransferase